MKKDNLSKLITDKTFIGQKSPWTTVPLTFGPLDKGLLGQRYLWTTVPWTNVGTPE